ncbi:MAG: glycosyltransferase [Bacteroidales bacterium]|nr:glycosyltransferase [Bacteroidales bacterium]
MLAKSYNIVIFLRELNTGGAEKQSLYIAKALSEIHNVVMVILHDKRIEEKYLRIIQDQKISYVFLKGSLLKKLIHTYQIIKKLKINIIISLLFVNNFLGSFLHLLYPQIYHVMGIRNSVIPLRKQIILRFLHNHICNYTIFNSYAGKDAMIKKGFKSSTCRVITNCIDPIPSFTLRKESKQIKILTVARFKPQKDYITALKAIDHLNREISSNGSRKIKYYLVGYGMQETYLRRLIHKMHLDDYCEVSVNPRNLSEYYLKSDIYLSTSLYEGFSNSIMEAVSYSLPVVATDVGDNNKIVTENESGFLIPLRDYELAAKRLKFLAESHDARIQFGAFGYKNLCQRFTFINFKNEYLEFIESMIHGKTNDSHNRA